MRSPIQNREVSYPSYNIIHSNLNGLESKIDLLNKFIKTTKTDIDIICISEMSKRKCRMANITLKGYNTPFSQGSKSAKGGVAIYTKSNKYNIYGPPTVDLRLDNEQQ